MSEPTRTQLELTMTALRERAVVLRQGRWSDGPEDAELMEHAADAIEGLESKNAKLRELCKELLDLCYDAYEQKWGWDDDWALAYEQAKKLGVEVSE